MQAMHGRLGDPESYQALQHFITHSPWDADARVDAVARDRALTAPAFSPSMTRDSRSRAPSRPACNGSTCGALGKIGNCQVAVSSALIADGRTWPLAFDLYLPTSWTDDPARCAAAGIPPTVRFREKWRIALAQVRTVQQAGFTITGVVVDADYGANAAFRAGLERLGLAYGVAIRGEATFAVAGVPGTLSADGPRDCPRPTTRGSPSRGAPAPLVRSPRDSARCASAPRRDGATAGSSANARRPTSASTICSISPATTPLVDLVALARSRWPIEQQYRELKDDLGLDHFEGRTYQGWAHHVVLTAVAFTFLQIERRAPRRAPAHAARGPRVGPRNHGPALRLHNRRLLSDARQLPPERAAPKVSRSADAPRVDHPPRRLLLDRERDLRVRCDADSSASVMGPSTAISPCRAPSSRGSSRPHRRAPTSRTAFGTPSPTHRSSSLHRGPDSLRIGRVSVRTRIRPGPPAGRPSHQ